jgi:mRNA interferase MazF
MKQGDVYWFTFKEPDKRRPVLILTRTSAISFLTGITVAPITTTIRGIPSEVVLTITDGLFEECAVNLDNLQTIAKAKFGGFITHLRPEKLRAVHEALCFALALDSLGGELPIL